MTEYLRITVVVLVAVNAAAVAGRVPQPLAATSLAARAGLLAIAMAAAIGVSVALAGLHDGALDGLDIEPETFRVSAGLIAALGGGRVLIAPRRRAPAARPRLAPLVPVAFPLLLTPELAVLSVSYAADDGVATTAAALVTAGAASWALTVWLSASTDAWHDALVAGVARLAGALLVVAGAGLMVAGIRAI